MLGFQGARVFEAWISNAETSVNGIVAMGRPFMCVMIISFRSPMTCAGGPGAKIFSVEEIIENLIQFRTKL